MAALALAAAAAVVAPLGTEASANVGAAPGGAVDGCDAQSIWGWTKDPDFAGSLSVHVYRGGPAGTGAFVTQQVAAEASEPATGGSNQRFHIGHGQPPGTRLFVHTLGVDAAGAQNHDNPVLPQSVNAAALTCVVPGSEPSEDTKLPGQNCEPAFVVKDYAGVPGALGAISAGHCDSNVPGKVFQVYEDKDFEVIPLDINRLNAPTVSGGQELRSANFFRANVKNDVVFAGTDRTATVNPTAIGWVGGDVCRYGGVTPTQCGQVVRDDYQPSYINQSRDFYLLNIPCSRGDSGSAIISGDGSRAVGIVSGRRLADGACIVSRLDRIYPGAMQLYQPPPVDAEYWFAVKLDGTWTRIGSAHHSRSKCVEVLEASAGRGLEAYCYPVS